jgi:hypothetical protein
MMVRAVLCGALVVMLLIWLTEAPGGPAGQDHVVAAAVFMAILVMLAGKQSA